jgi:flagellar biosynthesis/type III secretory pathway ATPase
MPSITTPAHRAVAGTMRALLATYERARDLVTIGAYERGTNARLDEALSRLPAIEAFLQQGSDEWDTPESTLAWLAAAVGGNEGGPDVLVGRE